MTSTRRHAAIAMRCVIVVVALVAFLPFASAQDAQVTDRPLRTGYEVQQELIKTIHAAQDLLNEVGAYTYVEPALLTELNKQLGAVKFMSANELQSLATTDDTLWKLREEFETLSNILAEDSKGRSPTLYDGMNAIQRGTCIEGGYYPSVLDGTQDAFDEATGPCEQTGFSGVELSDVRYQPVCPRSTRPGALVIGRTILAVSNFADDLGDRLCEQSIFGNNTSTACTVTTIIAVVAKTTFDALDGCNGKRGDAELVIAYSRTGEIFLSNKENFDAQDDAMKANFDKVITTNSVLSALVVSEKNATLMELDQGFSGTTERLVQIETQSIEHSQQLSRVLAEQRTIMAELGIEHLYRDPNTPISNFVPTGFLLIAPASDKDIEQQNGVYVDETGLFRLGSESSISNPGSEADR